jgi:hypothetical protein
MLPCCLPSQAVCTSQQRDVCGWGRSTVDWSKRANKQHFCPGGGDRCILLSHYPRRGRILLVCSKELSSSTLSPGGGKGYLLLGSLFLAVPGLKDKTYPAAFPSGPHKWGQMASQENSNFFHQSTLSGMFLRHTVICWLPDVR